MKWLSLGAALLMGVSNSYSQTISIDNEAGSAFKTPKRVVISQFGVEFYTQYFVRGQSGKNVATQLTKLVGVSQPAMQSLVDNVYGEAVTKLKEAGFEVLDYAVLATDPEYQSLMKDVGKTSPYVVRDSVMTEGEHLSQVMAPAGMSAFYASGGSSGGKITGNRANMSDRIDSQNYKTGQRESEIAKRLDATLLKFNFLANYGSAKASENGFLGAFTQSAARVAIEAGAVLVPFETQIQFVNAEGPRIFGNIKRSGQSGAFYLDKPMQGDKTFELADVTTSESKSGDAISNAITGLFGGGGGRKNQALDVKADDKVYVAAFSKLLSTANEALIKSLK